jgi:hypothetical protein
MNFGGQDASENEDEDGGWVFDTVKSTFVKRSNSRKSQATTQLDMSTVRHAVDTLDVSTMRPVKNESVDVSTMRPVTAPTRESDTMDVIASRIQQLGRTDDDDYSTIRLPRESKTLPEAPITKRDPVADATENVSAPLPERNSSRPGSRAAKHHPQPSTSSSISQKSPTSSTGSNPSAAALPAPYMTSSMDSAKVDTPTSTIGQKSIDGNRMNFADPSNYYSVPQTATSHHPSSTSSTVSTPLRQAPLTHPARVMKSYGIGNSKVTLAQELAATIDDGVYWMNQLESAIRTKLQ